MERLFKIHKKLEFICENIQTSLKDKFKYVEQIGEHNEKKVLKAFINCKVFTAHLSGSTGYGYDDIGKKKLDELYAKIFGSEDALVRSNFVSGTHAISIGLFSILKNKDTMLCITGTPYPTILKTIGIIRTKYKNSLMDFGVKYKQIDIFKEKKLNLKLLSKYIKKYNVKLVYIQRSKGYSVRKAVSCDEIEKISKVCHSIREDIVLFVDNCYCEFVEKKEPTQVGADILCGSLIKNPGGGIANVGGYIVGRKILIELCAQRLAAPGLFKDIGCNLDQNRNMFLGIFLAPMMVCNAVKTSIFARSVFSRIGFKVFPDLNSKNCDIVSVIELKTEKALTAFCTGIQNNSPIDSIYTPTPAKMPGYPEKIIMAAGTFVNGASLELSADGCFCKPYNVFLQGGLSYSAAKTTILCTIKYMQKQKILDL